MQNKSNIFDAGTLEIEIINTKNTKSTEKITGYRFIPNSAKIGINFGDISYSIEFTVPSISQYFFELNDGNEVRVYIDGEFYCGGFLIGRNGQNNSWAYKCIGYGYEITKTYCLPLANFTENMQVGTFILQTIRQNLIKRNKKIIIKDKVNSRTEVITRDIRIGFVLYDPNRYGDEIIIPATESKYADSILSYLNTFLKPKNLFMRCLGSLDNVREDIKKDILNNRINNAILSSTRKSPRESKVFILELYKATVRQTGSSLTLDPRKKTDFSLRSEGKVSDNIVNQQANFTIDYSNRYGCYFATSKNAPNVDTKTINNFAEDPVISDGTVKVIEFDLHLGVNDLQNLLYYEVNKRVAESYTYNCTVIGFRQGLNINNVNNGIKKSTLPFWDINQNVQVTDVRNGIENNQFLIKSVTLNWDKTGAKTNLNCTLPNSYSLQKPPTSLEKEHLDEVKREAEMKIFLHKPGFYLRPIKEGQKFNTEL